MRKGYHFQVLFIFVIYCQFTLVVYGQGTIPFNNMVNAAAYAEDVGGAAVLIYQKDSIIFENYQNGADSSVVTHIFSATKAYWSMIAAAAKEAGSS